MPPIPYAVTVLFCTLVALAAYASSLACGFVFDDRLAILDNADLQLHTPVSELFVHDFWGKPLVKEDSHKSYRPLTILSFRAHTWLSSGGTPRAGRASRDLNATPFHATNAVLHAAVTACVSTLAAFAWPARRGRARVALLSGLLFAVHPVHVEAVTGVVGRAELLCALACFGGARAYAALGRASAPTPALALALGVVACFAVAVLCKETGVTLLGVLGAHEIAVVLPARGLRHGLLGTIGRSCVLGACAVGYAALRLHLMRPPGAPVSFAAASLATSGLIRRAENPLAFVPGRLAWALSVCRVQLEYVRLLLWPATLSIEYSFDCVPMADEASLVELSNAVPVLLVTGALLGMGSLLWRACFQVHARHTLVAAAWLLMPWVPISHVPLRLGTLVAERTLYLPSVGAVLLLVNALRPTAHRSRRRRASPSAPPSAAPPAAAPPASPAAPFTRLERVRRAMWGRSGAPLIGLIIGALAARTLRRTLDWRTDETAFEAAILACPRSAKLHQQMCTLRTQQRRFDEAAVHCAASEEIDPLFCDVHKSKGYLAIGRDDVGGAIEAFNTSLTCVYTNLHAYKVLLTVYDLLHARDPRNGSLYEQMGRTQATVGNRPYALALLREAAALHLRKKEPEKALAATERGRELLLLADQGDGASASGGDGVSAGAGGVLEAAELRAKDAAAVSDEEPTRREACALEYWHAQALKGTGRLAEARDAFTRAMPCPAHPALALAAETEARRLRRPLGTALARKAKAPRRATASVPELDQASSRAASSSHAAARDRRLAAERSLAASPPSSPALPHAPDTTPHALPHVPLSPPRVLLLTFHGGVAASVRWAAQELGWILSTPDLDEEGWLAGCEARGHEGRRRQGDEGRTNGSSEGGDAGQGGGGGWSEHQQPSSRYRFDQGRAQCLWRRNQWAARLAPYDLVIVGDTAPLAWPLLDAGWPQTSSGAAAAGAVSGASPSDTPPPARRPKLLLWVCNRFDYGAVGDEAWYAAVRSVRDSAAVTVVSSTHFEWWYATHVRAVDFPSPAVLRPIGLMSPDEPAPHDPVPASVDRPASLFVLPKVNEARLGLAAALAARGLPVWTSGVWPDAMQQWGGPMAVRTFRAVVHVPYAPTTFALFEHAQAGLITFIPTPRLLVHLYQTRGLFFQSTRHDFVTTGAGTEELTEAMLGATEWYSAANDACFVQFDSLDDLEAQLRTIDLDQRRHRLQLWAHAHTNTTRARWRMLDRFLLRTGADAVDLPIELRQA
jgi:tetratricopeptide (TPR) repeat protein